MLTRSELLAGPMNSMPRNLKSCEPGFAVMTEPFCPPEISLGMFAASDGFTRTPAGSEARLDDWIVTYPAPLLLTGRVNQPVMLLPALRMIVSPRCEVVSAE